MQADLLRDSGHMQQALERAERLGRPVLVSVTRPMPTHDPLLELERDRSTERLIWLTPGGESLVGLGAAYAIEARGPDRFAEAGDVWSKLLADAVIDDPASQAWTGPLALGGFSFDPLRPRTPLWSGFPDGRLVVPERMLVQRGGHAWLTTNCLVGSESEAAAPVELRSEPEPELDAEAWQALVRATAMGMRQHELGLEKVVLARSTTIRAETAFDTPAVMRRLSGAYPTCTVFGILRGSSGFVGATPERLVALSDGVAVTAALAGSTRRGATPDEDMRARSGAARRSEGASRARLSWSRRYARA